MDSPETVRDATVLTTLRQVANQSAEHLRKLGISRSSSLARGHFLVQLPTSENYAAHFKRADLPSMSRLMIKTVIEHPRVTSLMFDRTIVWPSSVLEQAQPVATRYKSLSMKILRHPDGSWTDITREIVITEVPSARPGSTFSTYEEGTMSGMLSPENLDVLRNETLDIIEDAVWWSVAPKPADLQR